MIRRMLSAVIFLLLWVATPLQANIEAYHFDDPQLEVIYKELIFELRCLVCQNQNLADSNAELAQDLRRQTYEMLVAGKSREEVVNYMVQRYGDFVLYRPPLQKSTLLLWIGPFIIFAVGVFGLLLMVRRRARQQRVVMSESEQQRAAALLGGTSAATAPQDKGRG
ncbi:MAG: cytochrome c-type biogenesis protein CcmH [Gammaproteobacteria bacterium]|nr:cytochrome c-type biogenesis protein CcmH [Gammaproteobacteria bacterium]